jgi:His/Glu/Gln/Arg/opine family amino acid ABC transporter permease subunit
MTTMQERRPGVVNQAYYEEPAVKPPPMLAVGPLAWMRENLFGSALDTILTILGTLVVIGAVSSFLTWAIGSANWFAVTYNLRLFMIGRITDPLIESRVQILALLIMFIVGVNLAAWSRVSVRVWATLAVVVALTFVLPALISALVPTPPTYLAAGQIDIVSGSVTETPLPQLGFIAREGETITLRAADQPAQTDAALAQINSFTDRAANAVRNAATNRLSAQTRIAELERLLAGDAITVRQREQFAAELESLTVPPPVTETLVVNQHPIEVRILDGDLEPLASATLTPDSEPLAFTVPGSGWYVLEKSVAGSDESVGLLSIHGIYPIFARDFLRSTADGGSPQRVFEYIRATDNFRLEGGRPRIGGEEVAAIGIIDHQYKGFRPFSDYLTLSLAPLLNQIKLPLALFLLLAILGYYSARLADSRFSTPLKPRQASRRSATWLWIALPVVAFVLIAGVMPSGPLRFSEPPLWGGFLLTMMLTAVGIVAAFPIGVALALGRRSSLPVVSTFSTLYIELVRGVPLITVLFMSMLLVPFVIPSLGGPDTAPYRAMVAVTLFSAAYLAENVRGGLQSLPPGQEEAAKAVGLSGWQTTLYITLPQALRAVIPALVGQFISLYKDTSLVAIVGLIDLTGVTRNVAAQTEFQGLLRETYVFISVIYFIFSYVMSIVSRRIEASGSGAARRI